MIKPVQRITKYQLLLREALRLTERTQKLSEIEGLRAAVHVMRIIPKAANDMMDVARLQGFDVSNPTTIFSPSDVVIRLLIERFLVFLLLGKDYSTRKIIVAWTALSVGIFIQFTKQRKRMASLPFRTEYYI